MSLTIGLDIGTTTITALALDAGRHEVVAQATFPNDAEITSPADAARGRSEWDAERMAQRATAAVRAVAGSLGPRRGEVAGLGLTGQQHGVVLVDERSRRMGPFVGWRDRRGLDPLSGDGEICLARAARLSGAGAPRRTGCTLATGFMGATLFWLKETGGLPATGTACFITDYLGAVLTGEPPVTDPTMGASSGLFNLAERRWDGETIRNLGLPLALFPEVREAGEQWGRLTADAARTTDLPAGVPVFVGLGDNQASFLGSVADRGETVQVNVGTGGQVGRYTDRIHEAPPLETRPFPRGGYLLVEAGLCGGRSYATLRQFFGETGTQMFGAPSERDLYAAMNALAKRTPRGAGGVRCEPFFTGTRAEPGRRAGWSNISEENFTPGNMIRALLEGMARVFRDGYGRIATATGSGCARLVGAGNGVRENPVLAGIIAEEFGLPLALPTHREEAAFGAALIAALGAGIVSDLAAAGRVIRYRTP
jgi:sugar (pentulose or hexulose) kinase